MVSKSRLQSAYVGDLGIVIPFQIGIMFIWVLKVITPYILAYFAHWYCDWYLIYNTNCYGLDILNIRSPNIKAAGRAGCQKQF